MPTQRIRQAAGGGSEGVSVALGERPASAGQAVAICPG